MKTILLLLFVIPVLQAKLIIICDIDDTLRVVNTTNKKEAIKSLISGIKPYGAIRELLWATKDAYEKKGEEVAIYYVSASHRLMYDAKKWVFDSDFPIGNAIQKRAIIDPKNNADFKASTITQILQFEGKENKILMFGDSGQLDALAYERVIKTHQLENASIYIRELGGKSPHRSKKAKYFLTEDELFKEPSFSIIPKENLNEIRSNIFIADFVKKNLQKDRSCKGLLLSLLRG